MKLSNKAKSISPSKTLELADRVTMLRSEGKDIIGFTVGEPDLLTPDNIKNAGINAINDEFTKYTAASGINKLKEVVSKTVESDTGVKYTNKQICISSGAKQAIYNTLLALCDTGDEVIVLTPCWVSYIEMIKLVGANPVTVPTDKKAGFMPDIKKITEAITPKTVGIMINSPNNPTGAIYSKSILKQIAAIAKDNNLFIISDEIYGKLNYSNEPSYSIASVNDYTKDNTIIINGVSKAYSMTGWRIGYSLVPEKLAQAISSIQSHTTSNACSISQLAALEALSGDQEFIYSMKERYSKRRNLMLELLNRIPGVSTNESQGAFYLFPDVSELYGKSLDGKQINSSVDLSDYLLDEAGIAVVPGDAFYSPDNIRLSYSISEKNIIKGIKRMETAVKKLQSD